MSLESQIEDVSKNLGRIADALETLVAAGGNVTAAPKTTAAPAVQPPLVSPKPPRARAAAPKAEVLDAPGETIPTMDDLIDALRDLVNTKGAIIAKGLLAEYGAGKVSELKAEVYLSAYKAMKAAKDAS